ncbi:MAG: hypothetical protein GEV08_10230 [Acidimicrobiia bacterium]|nr:hypothetical protein [Acidimicrobiia bacterium]
MALDRGPGTPPLAEANAATATAEDESAPSSSTEARQTARPSEDESSPEEEGQEEGPEETSRHETSPTAAAGPGAAGVPDGQPVTCPAPTRRVSTADELQAALDAAGPGTSIELADGSYTGAFVAMTSGTADQPIFLCGAPGAVLDGGGIKKGYVLHLKGVQHWRLVGFTVRNGQKGVVADATSSSVVQGLTVEEIGDEAIHLRSASTYNAVLDNTVRRTGLRRDKFGEGVYVGSATSNWPKYSGGEPDRSDYNLVQGNDISETGSESIDVKEGTTGGKVIGNVMDGSGMTGADSLIDVKGNEWLVQGNVGRHAPEEGIQTHRILEGWGSRNTFRENTVDVDGDGNHFYVHDPDVTDNQVFCDNRSGSGDPIRSNVDCIP